MMFIYLVLNLAADQQANAKEILLVKSATLYSRPAGQREGDPVDNVCHIALH